LEIIARSLESLVAEIELCLEVPMVANYFVLEEFKDVIVRRLLQSQLKIKRTIRKNCNMNYLYRDPSARIDSSTNT
jgi:hypothetical protein